MKTIGQILDRAYDIFDDVASFNGSHHPIKDRIAACVIWFVVILCVAGIIIGCFAAVILSIAFMINHAAFILVSGFVLLVIGSFMHIRRLVTSSPVAYVDASEEGECFEESE